MNKLVKKIGNETVKRSPGILAGLGVIGMFTAIGMAIHATPKALVVLEAEAGNRGVEPGELKPIDTVKTVGVYYIPTLVTAVLSTFLIFEGFSISNKRHAALAAAYGLSEAALKDFQDKLVEVDGEKKLDKVRKAIAKDKVEKNPIENKEIITTNKGETLCYEPISGRYFKSDIDQIKKAVNYVNTFLLKDGYLSLNEFYYEIGLENTSIGNDIGWSFCKDNLIDLDFTATLASDGTPCLAIGYRNEPHYAYDRY
jgi:hypothetical protein